MSDSKPRRTCIPPLVAASVAGAVAAAIVVSYSTPARADPDRPGRDVFQEVCVACHGTGAEGAPKVGDRNAWQSRYARGLTNLGHSALEGVRKMPSHGGRMELTNLELERAITYMVNQSGGHWTEPINRARVPTTRSGEFVVSTQCSKCHQEGVGGAPKIGDSAEWIRRAQPGFDSLVRSAIAGHGGMPARGGEADLTDTELRLAITYMFQTSVATLRNPNGYGYVSGTANGGANGNSRASGNGATH